ncbi:MAG: recombination mediator RecR [Bacteroidia bacterium]|nr:recombination mediator RecR [Bacteroidia bacterium]MDW8236677.1 recombination mediator RecR [Bacteroidia bacterium]
MEGYGLPPALRSLLATLEKLPGIGPRSALRIAQAILKKPTLLEELSQALVEVQTKITPCRECGYWAEAEAGLCMICQDVRRTEPVLCVVKEPADVLAIERSQAFRGHYHILGGVLDPLSGITEKDLRLDNLWKRLQKGAYEEVLLALGTSPEAETTAYYIARQLTDWHGKITRFASGIPVGSELEYIDPLTLSRSLRERQPVYI